MLLEEDAQNDSSSSDSSMEGIMITLDQDLSFLADNEDDEEDDDDDDAMSIDVISAAVHQTIAYYDAMSIDVISAAVHQTIAYSKYIFGPLLDKTIDFDSAPL